MTVIVDEDGNLVAEMTPADAAAWVTESWRDSVAAIIETGRRLHMVKNRLGHGNWLPAVELMPFGESTAKYLMQTAAHPVLSNRHYSGDLPASWRTLSLLAQLPVADTEALIASGDINPELGQLQARALVAGHRDPDPVIDPVRPRDGTCRAVIQIASVRYGCDLSAPHAGWAHFCEDADAYWCSDGEARHVKAVS